MLTLIVQRVFWMIPTLLLISVISFFIIQLPPGDFLTSYISALEETGQPVDIEQVQQLRERYRLDRPVYIQYLGWMGGMSPVAWARGEEALFLGSIGHPILKKPDFGMSFEWNRPVSDLIGERLLLTMMISITTLLFTWALAIPIGIFSAVKQYSWGDYAFTLVGFIGLATPNFLLALIFMYVGFEFFDTSPGGLVGPEFEDQPWSLAKMGSFLLHIWVPVIVIGTAGTAGLIRVMRGNLLDELRRQYVITARAKGLRYWKLLVKYPVRVALNPIVSTVGWLLPAIVSGEIIVSVVLGLQTTGPLLLQALLNQDMFLAGSMVMLLSVLTVVGTLLSDILLLWLDPRIRYEQK
jgi:peptide/nickel transport system permease protein